MATSMFYTSRLMSHFQDDLMNNISDDLNIFLTQLNFYFMATSVVVHDGQVLNY